MDIELFIKEIEKMGIFPSEEKLEKLEKYYNLLVSWNEKINLTSITDKKQVYLKHFYDSLTVVKGIDLSNVSSLCDVGTGAGFPGIVLKIFYPNIELTLVDSLNKRILFLDEVIKELDLKNVHTVHVRAEEYAKDNREKFDVVTARAVSSFNVLLELCIPMLKVGGHFVAQRGNDDTLDSLSALKKLSALKEKVISFDLPCEDSKRTIVLVLKSSKTDIKYPRKFSEIKKHAL